MPQLSQKQKALIYDAEQLVKKFNTLFPVGSEVLHRKVNLKGQPFEKRIVKSEAYVSSSYDAVAFFEGLSGYYLIEPNFIDYDQVTQ